MSTISRKISHYCKCGEIASYKWSEPTSLPHSQPTSSPHSLPLLLPLNLPYTLSSLPSQTYAQYFKCIFVTLILYHWVFTIKLHSLSHHNITTFKGKIILSTLVTHKLMKRCECTKDRDTLRWGILTIFTFQMRSTNTLLSFTLRPTTQVKKDMKKCSRGPSKRFIRLC